MWYNVTFWRVCVSTVAMETFTLLPTYTSIVKNIKLSTAAMET